jgi:hypothetical protein
MPFLGTFTGLQIGECIQPRRELMNRFVLRPFDPEPLGPAINGIEHGPVSRCERIAFVKGMFRTTSPELPNQYGGQDRQRPAACL